MELSERKWLPFILEKIFYIESGKRLESYNMVSGTRPFIGATDNGNGITNYISNENESLDKNVLGVNYNGNGMVISFYHPYECIFSDDVKRFHLIETEDNKYVFLFFKTIILQQKSKYNYGYKFNGNRMKRQIILVPVDDMENPDYDFMKAYIKDLEEKKINDCVAYISKELTGLEYHNIPELNDKEWKEFKIGDIYEIESGCALTKDEMIKGKTPFIGASAQNNAVTNFISNINNSKDKNVVSINFNGSVGEAFYHQYEAIFSGDVKRLHLKNHADNKYVNLFITATIKKQKDKYSYGYKFSEQRMKKQYIILPVDSTGEPDYEYMEQYIKNLMIKKYNDYLAYVEK